MVKVGDWVKVHEDADGGENVPPSAVRVRVVRDNGTVYVETNTDEYCDIWYADEYEVVPSPGSTSPSVKREILERAITLIMGDRGR